MDRAMRRHQNDNQDEIISLKQEYNEILSFLYNVFSGRPFVLPRTRRPSRPAYDALMVGAALIGVDHLSGWEAVITQNVNTAAAISANYEVLVGRGNTVEAIKERVELARSILTT